MTSDNDPPPRARIVPTQVKKQLQKVACKVKSHETVACAAKIQPGSMGCQCTVCGETIADGAPCYSCRQCKPWHNVCEGCAAAGENSKAVRVKKEKEEAKKRRAVKREEERVAKEAADAEKERKRLVEAERVAKEAADKEARDREVKEVSRREHPRVHLCRGSEYARTVIKLHCIPISSDHR